MKLVTHVETTFFLFFSKGQLNSLNVSHRQLFKRILTIFYAKIVVFELFPFYYIAYWGGIMKKFC